MKKRYNRKIVDYNVCGSEAQRSVRGVVHEKSVFSVCVCVCVCLCVFVSMPVWGGYGVRVWVRADRNLLQNKSAICTVDRRAIMMINTTVICNNGASLMVFFNNGPPQPHTHTRTYAHARAHTFYAHVHRCHNNK